MVAPVTGPFTKTSVVRGGAVPIGTPSGTYRKESTWFRQRKPHNLPLEYHMVEKHLITQSTSGLFNGAIFNTANLPNDVLDSQSNQVYAKVYPSFVDQVKGASAELAVSLAERQQSIDMIVKRCNQLAKAYREVRRCRFARARKTLRMTAPLPRGLKASAKEAGNNWLEFWLGWSPLVGDIGNAVDVLQLPMPPFFVKARASESFVDISGYSGGVPYGGNRVLSTRLDTTVRWILSGRVQVTNPNLYLANQLGFVNPVAVFWATVPFSFIVDWFVNVGDFLGSFTDFWGVDLRDVYRTRYSVVGKTERDTWTYPPAAKSDKAYMYVGRVVSMHRNLGLPPGPALTVRAPWRLSSTRALTSVSLLLQQLRT